MDRLKKLNGLFPLFKPSGVSSAHALDQFKREVQKAAGLAKPLNHRQLCKVLKVGHGGTLDPLATGVLVVGLGSGCKKLGECLSGRKVYRFKARFGTHYDSYDCTGKSVCEKPFDSVTDASLREVMGKFTGQVMQRPPAFSAVHIDGKRAYELARAGEAVELPAKPVHIYRFELIDYNKESGEWSAETECGGGTYIRSLIVDVAHSLHTEAHMTELERVRQGDFALSDCVRLEDLTDLTLLESKIKQVK